MKNWHILGIASVLLAGCGAHAPDPTEEQGGEPDSSRAADVQASESADVVPEKTLAEVKLEGGTVTFYETDPYGIIVVARADAGVTLPEVLQERDVEAIQLYEALTNEAAPEALVLAAERQARLGAEDAARIENGEVPRVDEEDSEDLADAFVAVDDEVLAHDGNHSSTQWVDEYCNWSWPKYTACKTNRTCSDDSCEVANTSARWASGYANPYRGNIRYRFQRKNIWGNWKTKVSLEVTEGHTIYIKTPGWLTYKTGHRFHVLDGAGDGFHYQATFDW